MLKVQSTTKFNRSKKSNEWAAKILKILMLVFYEKLDNTK